MTLHRFRVRSQSLYKYVSVVEADLLIYLNLFNIIGYLQRRTDQLLVTKS